MKKFNEIKAVFFDFDGVFTDNSVWVSEDGLETVKCSRFDGIGLQKLRDMEVHSAVISSETNLVVQKRCRKLKIECYQGVLNKTETLTRIIDKLGLCVSEVAFLGNDINDLGVLNFVGYPFLVADAHEDMKTFEFPILKYKGGEGAVRELCDLLEKSKEMK